MQAMCQCGQLRAQLPEQNATVVACHCGYCQRRTGSPFGVLAYYPASSVTIIGETTSFTRPTASGNMFENFFCPTCGSTVYVRAAKHPDMLGVAVGTIADPAFPPPIRSVWEDGMHKWIQLPDGIGHFPRGRG